MAHERLNDVLEEVRRLAEPHQGALKPMNTLQLYRLIRSRIPEPLVQTTKFTKTLVVAAEEFRIVPAQDFNPLLVPMDFYGPAPYRQERILSMSEFRRSRDPDGQTRWLGPAASQPDFSVAPPPEARQALQEAVDLLWTLNRESLIDVAYSSVLRRDVIWRRNISPWEVDTPLVVASFARGVRAHELKESSQAPSDRPRLPGREETVDPVDMIIPNGSTCLKDGTEDALVVLGACAVLYHRGHKLNGRPRGLLSLLSRYYDANKEAIKAASRRKAEGEKAKAKEYVFHLEATMTPEIDALAAKLVERGLLDDQWQPKASLIRLAHSDRVIDLNHLCREVDDVARIMERRFKSRKHVPYQARPPPRHPDYGRPPARGTGPDRGLAPV